MQNKLPSLITPDAQAGLALAHTLAGELCEQMEGAQAVAKRPGGMNYLQPAAVPKEIATSILFYAIAAANHGWSGKN